MFPKRDGWETWGNEMANDVEIHTATLEVTRMETAEKTIASTEEEDALTEQTITETLKRVTDEIIKEESEKYQAEQAAHRRTQEELAAERADKKRIREHLYWRARRRAEQYSWGIAIIVGLVLVVGSIVGLGVTSKCKIVGWVMTVAFAAATIAGVVNLFVGITVKQMREKLERILLLWQLKRAATATGLDLEDM